MKIKKRLSERELEVLILLTHGLSSREIASQLFLSIDTIKSHRKNLIIKLSAKNVANLVRIAFEENVINLITPEIPTSKILYNQQLVA